MKVLLHIYNTFYGAVMYHIVNSVADPGFPKGGCAPIGGHGPQSRRFSVKMYAKTKELGPIGEGVYPACPP